MKMRLTVVALVGALILVGSAVSCVADGSAETYELSLNTWVSNESHPLYVNILKPWADEIESKTNGRVKTTIHVNQGLASMANSYDACVDGVCDITGITGAAMVGRFPLASMPLLPVLYMSAEEATLGLQDLYAEYPQFLEEELGAVHVLWDNTNDPTNLLNVSDTPVETLEELQAQVVGTFGAATDMLKLLGTNPAVTTQPEVYGMMERGVIDSIVTNWGWFRAAHMEEVTSSYTLVGFYADHMMYVMNKDVYEGFPDDIREVIDEVSATKGIEAAKMFDRVAIETTDWLKQEYPEKPIASLDPDELARWRDMIAPLHDVWVDEATEKGYPARQMLDDYIEFCLQHRE